MSTSITLHRIIHFLKYLIKAKDEHSIHSPFLFDFVTTCFDTKNYFYAFDELNIIRQQLLKDENSIEYSQIGSPSYSLKKNTRKIKDITKVSVSPQKYSELYFKIIQFLKAKDILELGTSLGLNTMYLAKATTGKVISIEGQKSLFTYAQNLLNKNKIHNVQLINAYFDDALSFLLKENIYDFILIDGNHTYDATLRYFNLISNHTHPLSVIIIDDIYWSPEMTKAWQVIQKDNKPKITIDIYRAGIVIFNPNIIHPQHFILKY